MIPLNTTTFVASIFGSGEARRGSIPRSGGSRPQLPGENHLERHWPIEAHLPGPIDHAHAAARDFLKKFVIAEITDARISDFGFRISDPSVSSEPAPIPMANASRQAGQLPAGPSPESFAPHCGHVFTAGPSSSFNV